MGLVRKVTIQRVSRSRKWLESDFIALGDEPIGNETRGASPSYSDSRNREWEARERGHYHFLVYCTDESGLESFIAREIIISADAESTIIKSFHPFKSRRKRIQLKSRPLDILWAPSDETGVI